MDDEFTSGVNPVESILLSVKELLGLPEDDIAFDLDIMLNINSAIMTLRQIGVGPQQGFVVTSKDVTYKDWLGDKEERFQNAKMYLYYRTKMSFDPPASSSVMECLKKLIEECECRLSYEVDPPNTFEEVKEDANS